jgi:hypothetical protein
MATPPYAPRAKINVENALNEPKKPLKWLKRSKKNCIKNGVDEFNPCPWTIFGAHV